MRSLNHRHPRATGESMTSHFLFNIGRRLCLLGCRPCARPEGLALRWHPAQISKNKKILSVVIVLYRPLPSEFPFRPPFSTEPSVCHCLKRFHIGGRPPPAAFCFLTPKFFRVFLCNRREIKPLPLRNGVKNAENGPNRREIICLRQHVRSW
jgi:hypothetical protein